MKLTGTQFNIQCLPHHQDENIHPHSCHIASSLSVPTLHYLLNTSCRQNPPIDPLSCLHPHMMTAQAANSRTKCHWGHTNPQQNSTLTCVLTHGERSKTQSSGSGTCIPVRVALTHENVVPSLMPDQRYPYYCNTRRWIH